MTQDRIIEMAKQAGFHFHDAGYGPEVLHTEPHEYSQKCFERFAHLVRAQTLEEAAVVCEARSMAQFPQSHAGLGFSFSQQWDAARTAERQCASAIRLLKGQP